MLRARGKRGAIAAALILAVLTLVILVEPVGSSFTTAVDDLVQLLAASAAATACGMRAWTTVGRERVSWYLLAGAAGGWALGQAYWTYAEVVAGDSTPFPSVADIGFLTFPMLALGGLLVRSAPVMRREGRIRVGLDAVLVACSLFIVSWATTLGEVAKADNGSTFKTFVSLAYPVSDLVLLTVTVVVVANVNSAHRRSLLLTGASLAAMAIADSGFAYLTSVGDYATGNLVDVGWVGAFLLLVMAAANDVQESTALSDHDSLWALLLPYFPLLAAIGVGVPQLLGPDPDTVILLVGVSALVVIFLRQIVTLIDNRRLVERISHQAFHDNLTGLANRALFTDRVAHAVDLHGRDLRPVAVVYLDLDDFKVINDTMGHLAGDELLLRVADRLRSTVRTGDTVARLGGDEFAILVEAGGDSGVLARRLLEAMERPLRVAGRQIEVRASIGIASLDPDQDPIGGDELLNRADVAMYAAKRMGKAVAVHYRPDLEELDDAELTLRTEIASAVHGEAIEVAFQPIYSSSGLLCGFEALARWTHEGELVPPSRFLPLARRAGVLASLDEAVLEQAIGAASAWDETTALHVNVSLELLDDVAFPEWLNRILADNSYPPERLIVEVLESELVEHASGAVRCLHKLREMGVRIALDDFGVGYSSLSRLQSLPVDLIKVDRSFVTPLDDPAVPTTFFAGIVDLAHRIGAVVVAEGVETERQLRTVVALNCDAAQGYLLGRPSSSPLFSPPTTKVWSMRVGSQP